MAVGDYILCCKCEVKLLYDGDRGNRKWWAERFGSEPKIACPECNEWQGLTDEDKAQCIQATVKRGSADELISAIEGMLREKNT